MGYRSLVTTSFETLRKAKLAWLFALVLFGSTLLLSSTWLRTPGLLVCLLFPLTISLSITGSLGVLLCLYHARHDQTVGLSETLAEVRYWFFRCALLFVVWIIISGVPLFIISGLLFARLPYLAYNAMLLVISTYFPGFLAGYSQLSMIRGRRMLAALGYAWRIWKQEHGAKLLIAAAMYGGLSQAPGIVAALLANPESSILDITYGQYSLAVASLPMLLISQTWTGLLSLAWTAVMVSLYMEVVHQCPALDPAQKVLAASS